ncbi:uncharacterized protein MONBRDRAFT_28428 [Monosiga brevicollis MX1]|uniref:DNA-(apurinic or apyrimidinic site) lyase n=1 Tax=Monosiga brevicollis TaxID=81824 RepID=A9V852_MONBE|nr:uncharacterized protein MONBRDRAFT_28428 [Monosiga brevicollis MX1]EDQ86211.1 predicted protein [Monosiga brevicollis MX1]|eukprot:XP_001748881.1 hypothetical protein [Monosiga brevicollis MX1]
MALAPKLGWRLLSANLQELHLRHALTCGQAFGWSHLSLEPSQEPVIDKVDAAAFEPPAITDQVGVPAFNEAFATVLAGRAVILRHARLPSGPAVVYAVLPLEGTAPELQNEPVNAAQLSPIPEEASIYHALRDYFQLDVSLSRLYATWAAADPRMKTIADHLPGLRVLRQPPFECLISFICSSNNNIGRITLMLDRLKQHYGQPAGQLATGQILYSFPTLTSLSQAGEAHLRELGLGYRAKFITETCQALQRLGGEPYLERLRTQPYAQVQEIGAIPVDTHVWQIAVRDMDKELAHARSLTPTIYKRVGDLFRARYGSYAGWAHSLLFAAELPAFAPCLPSELVADIKAFRLAEKAAKTEQKRARKDAQGQPDTPSPSKTKSIKTTTRRMPAKSKGVTSSPKRPARQSRVDLASTNVATTARTTRAQRRR